MSVHPSAPPAFLMCTPTRGGHRLGDPYDQDTARKDTHHPDETENPARQRREAGNVAAQEKKHQGAESDRCSDVPRRKKRLQELAKAGHRAHSQFPPLREDGVETPACLSAC